MDYIYRYFKAGDWLVLLAGALFTVWLANLVWQGGAADKAIIRSGGKIFRELRPRTGRDAAVAEHLAAQPEAGQMLDQIETFLKCWLPAFESDQRSYLTVALGCTGGQHRSVYGVQRLAQRFQSRLTTLVRHRELDARE